MNPDEYRTISPAGDKMKICAFLWVYYGYPNSNYEGVNVEVMRYRNGAVMARDEAEQVGIPELDYVAGIPDSGTPHAIGYSTESKTAFGRPFIKYTPTWQRSFMPENQDVRNKVAKLKQISVPELIKDKELLFVDDSIVRGTQLRETVEFLYGSGAKAVHMRSACPPIMFNCKYLNFSSSKSEMDLIARRVVQQLEAMKASSTLKSTPMRQPSVENACSRPSAKIWASTRCAINRSRHDRAIGIDPSKICTYCWNGKE